MFIHKRKSILFPKSIDISKESIEVVSNFKLLGVVIDSGFGFNNFIKETKKSINVKLYSLKKLFYLSYRWQKSFKYNYDIFYVEKMFN